MRIEGKARPLLRTNSKHLPLKVRQGLYLRNELEYIENAEVDIKVTDRTGFGVVMIKKWGKDTQQKKNAYTENKGHLPWSQPSNGLQHCDDLLFWITQIVLEANPPRTRGHTRQESAPPQVEPTQLHDIMHHSDNRKGCVPWVTIVSDGGSDETMRNPANLLPLVQLMWDLDLDGVDKFLTCPGHSKMNPDERLNCQVKRPLRSQVIRSGQKSKEDLAKAQKTVLKILDGTTFAQEKIRYFIAPDEGTLRFPCNQADLRDYLAERTKILKDGSNWIRTSLPEGKLKVWEDAYKKECSRQMEGEQEDEESPDDMAESRRLSNFWELEERMLFLQRHLTVINLYMVTISKCDGEDDICDYCQNHPWKGSYSHTSRKDTICDQRCLGGPLCRHTINKELMESIEYFNLLTPSSLKLPRKCGICRQEGHTRRNCPQKQLVNTF